MKHDLSRWKFKYIVFLNLLLGNRDKWRSKGYSGDKGQMEG